MISVEQLPEENAVHYKVERAFAKFHCAAMDYKLNPLIRLNGTLDLVDYNSSIEAKFAFNTIPSPDGSNRELANVTMYDVVTNLDPDPRNVDFFINGTATAKALDSLFPVLKYAIKKPLEKLISYEVVLNAVPEI